MVTFLLSLSMIQTNAVSFSIGFRWSSEKGNLGENGNISINITPSNQFDQSTQFGDVCEATLINGGTKVINEVVNNSIAYLLRDIKKEQQRLQKLDDACMQTIEKQIAFIAYFDQDKTNPRAQELWEQFAEIKKAYNKRKKMHILKNIALNEG